MTAKNADRSRDWWTRPRVALVCACSLAGAATVRAQDADVGVASFVRSRALDGVTSFETGSRTYTATDPTTPEITLVGVVHIGDTAYYDAIVAELATHDLVLYESVLPRGAFGTRGENDLERQRSTQDAMLFLRNLLAQYERDAGHFPSTVGELRSFIVARDTRLARPMELAFDDAWGRPVSYIRTDNGFELRSLGSDGVVGGDRAALDLVLGPLSEEVSQASTEEVRDSKSEAKSGDEAKQRGRSRDLYGELADALGVSLQVRSINYDRTGWEPADLPLEELLDRLWKRGERSLTLEMLSSESSGLQQSVVRFLLSLVSNSPSFKQMVVRALGEAGARSSGLSDVDQRIILDERNDAVLDHLRLVLKQTNPPKRIAIFYGAAHMPDFEGDLVGEFGMTAGPIRWQTAMSVDEWTESQVRARLQKFQSARTELLANDPNGAYPEAARIEWRIAALERRLRSETPSAPAN